MTSAAHPHEVLLEQVEEEFNDILAESTQGIYIYLDDPHWVCSDRLAAMLGYGSASELKLAVGSSFLDTLVTTDSQPLVVDAYMGAANRKVASAKVVIWKKKGGGTLKTQTILAPISFRGTVLVIHFVTPM